MALETFFVAWTDDVVAGAGSFQNAEDIGIIAGLALEGEVLPLVLSSPGAETGSLNLDEEIGTVVEPFVLAGKDASGRRGNLRETLILLLADSLNTLFSQVAVVQRHRLTGNIEVVDDILALAGFACSRETDSLSVLLDSANQWIWFSHIHDNGAFLPIWSGSNTADCCYILAIILILVFVIAKLYLRMATALLAETETRTGY